MTDADYRSRYAEKAPMQYSGAYQQWRAALLRGDKAAAKSLGREQSDVAERARVEAFALTYEVFFASPSRSRRRRIVGDDQRNGDE